MWGPKLSQVPEVGQLWAGGANAWSQSINGLCLEAKRPGIPYVVVVNVN